MAEGLCNRYIYVSAVLHISTHTPLLEQNNLGRFLPSDAPLKVPVLNQYSIPQKRHKNQEQWTNVQTSIQNHDPHTGPIQKTQHLTTYNQGMDSSSYIWGGHPPHLWACRGIPQQQKPGKGGSEADGRFSNGQKSKG